jgi:ABC-2 type transport system ATP-binding protein
MMRVEHLAYQFSRNGQPFFKDVSFQLKSPGVNFLIGQNGAGKTTLADIITGLRPAQGELDLPKAAIYLNQQLRYCLQFVCGTLPSWFWVSSTDDYD